MYILQNEETMEIRNTTLIFDPNDTIHQIRTALLLVWQGKISHINVLCQNSVWNLRVVRIKGEENIAVTDRTKARRDNHIQYIAKNMVADYIVYRFTDSIFTTMFFYEKAEFIEYVTPEPEVLSVSDLEWDDIPNNSESALLVKQINAGECESVFVAGFEYRIGVVLIQDIECHAIVILDSLNGMCFCIDSDDAKTFIENKASNIRPAMRKLIRYATKTKPYSEICENWIGEVVRLKSDHSIKSMIVGVTADSIVVGHDNYSLDQAFSTFEWNDGTIFGNN